MKGGSITTIDSNFKLIDIIFDFIKDISPKVVYGLIPHYYPSVANISFDSLDSNIRDLSEILSKYSESQFGMSYQKEYYYTGISDLSYTSIENVAAVKKSMEEYMPLFGNIYDLPLEEIGYISMPCINIGPWGKDFHKLTERVNTEDLLVRTPKLLDKAIKTILG